MTSSCSRPPRENSKNYLKREQKYVQVLTQFVIIIEHFINSERKTLANIHFLRKGY